MSQLVVITRGLPYSGKSSFARQWVAEKSSERSRVSRDDIRLTNFGSYVIEPSLEKVVTTIEHATLRALLQAGRSVVIDNQNLREDPVLEYLQIAEEYNATVLYRDFSIELKEALRRHAAREDNKLPVEVVRAHPGLPLRSCRRAATCLIRACHTLGCSTWTAPSPSSATIAAPSTGRSFWMTSRTHRWCVCFSSWPQQVTRSSSSLAVKASRSSAASPAMSGMSPRRDDPAAEGRRLAGQTGDGRRDSIVKREIFDREIRPYYCVQGVVDDRLQVVRMWHHLGVPVFRVGNPDAIY